MGGQGQHTRRRGARRDTADGGPAGGMVGELGWSGSVPVMTAGQAPAGTVGGSHWDVSEERLGTCAHDSCRLAELPLVVRAGPP